MKKGYSLIELLVVIAIIGLLASLVMVATSSVRVKARDTKRKSDLAQINKLLSASNCFVPSMGFGDYDLIDIANDLKNKNPQYASFISMMPKDPKSGTKTVSQYRYIIKNINHCAIYANLENESEKITLSISQPDPEEKTGILKTNEPGPNGTDIFYQISK